MDEAETREDGAENEPRSGDRADGHGVDPSTEDTTEGVGVFQDQDYGEALREDAVSMEQDHQQLQENIFLDDQLDGLHGAEKDKTPSFCTLCSLSFIDLSEFNMHMEKYHAERTSRKESGIQVNTGTTKQHIYECPECGKSYGVIGHFLNHQRSHRQASKSVFHDLEHLKKKSFQCESCGRNYSRASALDAHRRCHEEKLIKSRNRSSGDSVNSDEAAVEVKSSGNQADDNPQNLFRCSCGKAFSALTRLKTHKRFSRNAQCTPEDMKEKPKKTCNEYYCNECKKSFSGHIALINHQRWHVNRSNDSAKRFPCEECGKVFMTLTFYYRHQRIAHSEETPAKSFLHQVCQLQKKAFECQHCGLKFSRASALHSHQLHHTDVFTETEKEAQTCTSLLPQPIISETNVKEAEKLEAELEKVLPTFVTEEDSHVNETDEDLESYEPGDFNVQVISASESEEEPIQDLNPDLELLCESDQEVQDNTEGSLISKPEMDLKIVQIDFEPADEQGALMATEVKVNMTGERFDCPECYRWFSSASSLRVHRMWHSIHKRKQQAQCQSVAVYKCDTSDHETSSYAAHCNHTHNQKDQNTSSDGLDQEEGLETSNLTCSECGECFASMSALESHQLHHPKRKQFQCPGCMMSYMHAASLFNHMKNCSAHNQDTISVTKKEYNPKKTLLGPKTFHCEQCGKGFWSLGAYSHHKQNRTECADLRLRKGVGSSHSVNGHPRSSIKVACPVCGRKFRHKGIMALHMRKHENGNHKCELCNRSFRLFSSLLRHQVVHNAQLLPPPCKSFQHQVEQLKKNTYSCPDCGKLFSRAKALQFHMKSHGYENGQSPSSPRATVTLEALQCVTCLSHFSNKASLRSHQKHCIKRESQARNFKTEPSGDDDDIKHNNSNVTTLESSELLTLGTVNTEAIDRDGLNIKFSAVGNVKTNSTDLKYKCKKCDRSFSVVGALNFHKRIHAEGYKSVAKTKLTMSVTLKKPKQEEAVKGLFHCSECGRRFMSNSALGSHKRWHKEKKFSRRLLKDDNMKSINYKTEEGLFHCNKCGKQFYNRYVLQLHQIFNSQCQMKSEPKLDSTKTVESNNTLQFSCPECDKTFVQRSFLAAHYQNKHGKILDAVDHQDEKPVLVNQLVDKEDIGLGGQESSLLKLKLNSHQCPLCSMTFAKARGLRAHKWQAHSKNLRGKIKVPLGMKKTCIDSPVETAAMVDHPEMNSSPVEGGRKKTKSDQTPGKSVSCLDCGKLCSCLGALLEHSKVCPEAKQDSMQEVQTPEAMADVLPQFSNLSNHAAKCLFKCDNCGKAFQTEEQLRVHKAKAKSRPYCCALCCHGFWTENQLQQHLVWHDEVRCRLPNEVRYRLSAAMTSASKPLKTERLAMHNHN
ncbi:zinc finger protein 91 isoform X1 [Betta splendens]|uniref:Zinc finger protein 91 isoform X1 n=1 Tax=Betta splendens TaxID=158456 RepID=A0A6P7KRD7_BETSP|nr:zinc finger protein 91 isoform X1 [Betta splendens]